MSRMMSGRLRTRTSLQFPCPVVVEGGLPLDVGAHGAVVDYDAVLYELEKFGHWWSVVRRWSFVVRGFVVAFCLGS